MRAQNQLLFSRTRVKPRYALLPLEGIPASRLPEWAGVEVRVLAAPVLGAGFAEYLLAMPKGTAGEHKADGAMEFFFYVLDGAVSLEIDGGKKRVLAEGGFALLPPTADFKMTATRGGKGSAGAAKGGAVRGGATVLMLRKRYEHAEGVGSFEALVGREGDVKGATFCGDPGAQLQLLIPDELKYDLAMNIFTFEVGHSLPVVETHVMEHGLYFLEGKGIYFLDDTWMEVEATDFIWMGPFCPQSYYATGPVASRYLYYKNVNREIGL